MGHCEIWLFGRVGYVEFGQHLNNTGRPMVYSCSWPAYQEDKGMRVNKIGILKKDLLIPS